MRYIPNLLTATVAAALLAGCNVTQTSSAQEPAPEAIFQLGVDAQLDLPEASGPLHGAILWRAISDELEACMATAYSEDDIVTCADGFYIPGYALDSVPVEANQEAGIALPVYTAPSGDVAADNYDGALGLGMVLLFEDRNFNQHLDILPAGAPSPIDMIVAASQPDGPAPGADYVIYREGDLSPVWKLYATFLGCAEPAEGFSIMRLVEDPMVEPYGIRCDIIDGSEPISVFAVTDEGTQTIMCEYQPLDYYGYPGETFEPNPTYCYSYDLAIVNTAPGAFCPDLRRYDLMGCHDLSSESACYASIWDKTQTPPEWWPCPDSAKSFSTANGMSLLTSEPGDHLFDWTFTAGNNRWTLDDLTVISLNRAGDVAFTAENGALALMDNDGDGLFSPGDVLRVSEPSGVDLFNSDTPLGYYSFRLTGTVLWETEFIWSTSWTPGPLPEQTTELDMTVALGDPAVDRVVTTLQYDAPTNPEAPSSDVYLDPAALTVSFTDFSFYLFRECYIDGTEPPANETWRQPCAHHRDHDGDGKVGPGDEIVITVTDEEFTNQGWEHFDPENQFSQITITRHRGPGWSETSFSWETPSP